MSVKSSVFKPVRAADRVDYPALERTIQQWWDEQGILQRYLHRNNQPLPPASGAAPAVHRTFTVVQAAKQSPNNASV